MVPALLAVFVDSWVVVFLPRALVVGAVLPVEVRVATSSTEGFLRQDLVLLLAFAVVAGVGRWCGRRGRSRFRFRAQSRSPRRDLVCGFAPLRRIRGCQPVTSWGE